MTRRLRALNKGRARIWWVHHGRDAIHAMQLVALVGLWLLASAFDYQDQLDAERASRAKVEAQLADIDARYGPPTPPVVFVLEARTPRELELRLAEISGATDRTRYDIFKERVSR